MPSLDFFDGKINRIGYFFLLFFMLLPGISAYLPGFAYMYGLNATNVTTTNISASQICLTSGVCLSAFPGWVFSNYFDQSVNISANVTFNNLTVNKISFNTSYISTGHHPGQVHWNSDDGTLDYDTNYSGTHIQIGQEEVVKVVNKAGYDLNDGTAVFIFTAQGNRPAIMLASNNASNTSFRTLGVTTMPIKNNEEGLVTTFGLVRDFNTAAWNVGDQLYLGVNGTLVNRNPFPNNYSVEIGIVTVSHAIQGTIFININIINPFNQNLNTNNNVSFYNVNGSQANFTGIEVRGQSSFGWENWTQAELVPDTLTYVKGDSLINPTGRGSFAGGYATKFTQTLFGNPFGTPAITYINASGRGSFAFGAFNNQVVYEGEGRGYNILAKGDGSFAGGFPTIGNIISNGNGSFSWGIGYFNNTHAGGFTAGGSNSLLNGESGIFAGVAIGAGNTVNESYGVAIGFQNVVATSADFGSAAIGRGNIVRGRNSYAFGYNNIAASGKSNQYFIGQNLNGITATSLMAGIGSNYFYADANGLNLSNNTYASRNLTVQNTSFAGNFVLLNANFKDYEVSLASSKAPASSSPTWTALLGSEVPAFSKTATNVLYFTGQLNHDYKENTPIEFHIHIAHPTATAGNSTWQFTYSWANMTNIFPTQSTIKINCTSPTGATTVVNRHDYCSFGLLTPTSANVSSVLLCSLSRLGGDAGDNYDDVVYGLSADFHYQVDTLGSRTATAK